MDDLDQPQDDGMQLVLPFKICKSNGGPYDDEAFAAGFQCGEIDRALQVGAAAGAETIRFPTVHTAILPQLELHAMNRGYPHMVATSLAQWPEWSDVRFSTIDPEGGGWWPATDQ